MIFTLFCNEVKNIDRTVMRIKKAYPVGTRIELSDMAGETEMPAGLTGTVEFVDDRGQIHMKWDNGSRLALIPEEDSFKKIQEQQLAMKME